MSDAIERLPVVSQRERARRWRLVLGPAAEIADAEPHPLGSADDAEVDTGVGAGVEGGFEGGPESGLGDDDARIDAALGALYDVDRTRRGGLRAGGLGRSRPAVVRWLGDIRRYFPTPVVQVLQRDAIERLDLRQLLLEPELLDSVEPDLHLVTMLVELNRMLPDETRATARRVIAGVLAELQRVLAEPTRAAVRGALVRATRTARPAPGDVDWQATIAANLRHWLPEYRTVVPERLVGYGRRRRGIARDVLIAVDQSGSMADSVVHASLFAGVLAQMPALRTRFIAFDTAVADLTPLLDDPVDVLFGVQLGGGTDIANALAFCQQLVEWPRRTVLFVVSDLFEGGDRDVMLRRMRTLIEAGVKVVVLLALSDEGAPAHDADNAEQLRRLGAVVVAATPSSFPRILADTLG